MVSTRIQLTRLLTNVFICSYVSSNEEKHSEASVWAIQDCSTQFRCVNPDTFLANKISFCHLVHSQFFSWCQFTGRFKGDLYHEKEEAWRTTLCLFKRPTLPRRTTNQQLGLNCCSFNGRLEEKPNTAERIYLWLEMKFFTLPPSTTALAEWLKIIELSGECFTPSRERENISTLKAAADLRQ